MLVPYFEFKLTAGSGEPIPLEHLFLGPTLNINLSMDSLKLYLAKQGINPGRASATARFPTGSGEPARPRRAPFTLLSSFA